MSNWHPTPGVRNEPLSVAIMYPGDRVDKMLRPLETTAMDVAVEPTDAFDRDVVIADNADTDLGKEILRNLWTDSKLVYRLRGDLWRELELWDMHPLKKWAAMQVPKHVDGVISVTEFLAEKTRRKVGVLAGQAGMWIEPDDYPTAEHTDRELRAVTLTNADYRRKIWPILEWAPVVESVLANVGGEWRVYGDGGEAMSLREGLHAYEHVHYGGYIDVPQGQLSWANIMLHPSDLDGQPNAVLEGMASGLPVVTTDFIAFEEWQRNGAPILPLSNPGAVRDELNLLLHPATRELIGKSGREFAAENHTPEVIGQQYERFLHRLVDQ